VRDAAFATMASICRRVSGSTVATSAFRIGRRTHIEFMKLRVPPASAISGDDGATFLFKNVGHDGLIAGLGESLGRCAAECRCRRP